MKIGIVVDNPKRDLTGCLLLAKEFLEHNNEILLIPMYQQGYEIPLLNLDMVIVNYARTTNKEQIKSYHQLGIKIFVNDTEGGILPETGEGTATWWAKNFAMIDLKQEITHFFFWGEKVFNAYSKYGGLSKDQISLTGNPRFDIFSPQYANEGTYFLINTNFPCSNPKFNTSTEDEIKVFEATGMTNEFATLFIQTNVDCQHEVIQTVIKLAQDFPGEQFKVRPHPFECPKKYLVEFKNYKNITVDPEGEVHSALKNAKALIHLTCGTSVEAIMLGKLPICLEYINEKFKTNEKGFPELPRRVSLRPTSYQALKDIVTNIDAKQEGFNYKEVYDNIVYPWFYKNDGLAHKRISTIMLKDRERQANTNSLFMALRGSKSTLSLGRLAQGLLFQMFGGKTLQTIRNLISPARKQKAFSANLIKKILVEISCKNTTVKNERRFLIFPMASIKLAKRL